MGDGGAQHHYYALIMWSCHIYGIEEAAIKRLNLGSQSYFPITSGQPSASFQAHNCFPAELRNERD
jgi:hypothetical protein